VQSKALSGMDSLLSISQMPGGVPVGTLAIGTSGAINAALLAASILSSSGNYPKINAALEKYRNKQTENVAEFPVTEDIDSLKTPSPEKKKLFLYKQLADYYPLVLQ